MLGIKEIRFIKGKGNVNICVTPNGSEVVNVGFGYCKINKNNNVNKNSWYVGHDNNFEYWQKEKMFDDGYKIVEYKKAIA